MAEFHPGQRVWHIGQRGWPGAPQRGTATVVRVLRAKSGWGIVVQPDGERHTTEWFSQNTRLARGR